MPRAKKKPKIDRPASEPTAVADILDASPAMKAIIDARERKSQVEPEAPELSESEAVKLLADYTRATEPDQPGKHVAAELTRRPKFAAPAGFFGVASHQREGIRVSKSHDRKTAAIQFRQDSVPDRAEKDVLEAVTGGPGFSFNIARRQWERPVPEGMALGENTLDAERIVADLAKGREGRDR